HHQNDFTVVGLTQLAQQLVHVHVIEFTGSEVQSTVSVSRGARGEKGSGLLAPRAARPWGTRSHATTGRGHHGQGPTPLTAVQTRDLHSRGQQHQEGARDKVINNLVVKSPRYPAIMIGMSDRNEDDLNQYNRKGLPDLLDTALRGTNQAY